MPLDTRLLMGDPKEGCCFPLNQVVAPVRPGTSLGLDTAVLNKLQLTWTIRMDSPLL